MPLWNFHDLISCKYWCYSLISIWNPYMVEILWGLILIRVSYLDVTIEALGGWAWVLYNLVFFFFGIFGLPAAGWSANWVGFSIYIGFGFELDGEGPMMSQSPLRIGKILIGRKNINIELGGEIVVSVFGYVMPLGFRSIGTHLKLMLLDTLSKLKRMDVGDHVGVFAKIGNIVINLITQFLFLVIFFTASGATDWVGLGQWLNRTWCTAAYSFCLSNRICG